MLLTVRAPEGKAGAFSCGRDKASARVRSFRLVVRRSCRATQLAVVQFRRASADTLKQRRLGLDSFIDQEAGRLGTITKNSGLDQRLEFLLRFRRNFHGDNVIILC